METSSFLRCSIGALTCLQKLVMKKTILALALSTLIIPMQVAAQDLMTQCAKIEDQARRLECFDAVAKGSKGSLSSEQKFATVSRAAHTLMGAVDAGLNYMQFGERILAYSSELNVANGQAETENEKAAMERFRAALDSYSDSRTLWGADIRYNSSNTIHMPLLVVLVPDIVSRHNLPIVSGDLFGFTKGVDAPSAIRLLWAKAAGYIREADERLKAPVASAAPAAPAEGMWKASDTEKLYYYPTCPAADAIPILDLTYFTDEESAIAAGYKRSTVPGC